MLSEPFENEFLKNLGLLSKEQQDKVLSYIKSLLKKTNSQNNNQHELLQFAGSIDSKSIHEINTAIETGCENIDKNEW
jgi:hypothetical protein